MFLIDKCMLSIDDSVFFIDVCVFLIDEHNVLD